MSKTLYATMFILLFLHSPLRSESNKTENPHKNVRIFTNLSESDLSRVMNFMRASLGVHCDFCHVVGKKGWEWENDAKAPKSKAREMIKMVMDLNAANFKGEPVVSCFTCHQGRIRPNGTPPLPQAQPPYPTPIPQAATVNVDARRILDRYREATGGDHRSLILKARTLIFKGTTDETWKRKVVPIEVLYKAPDKWLVKKNLEDGVSIYVLNGEEGWVREGGKTQKMKEQGTAIFRDTIDSLQLFPELPSSTPVAVTERTINDRTAFSLEYKLAENVSEFFYFDSETHLLLGRKRYTDSPVGAIPQEIRYENYRKLQGAQIPYTIHSSYVDPWVGGVFNFTEIQVDTPLEDASFQMPSEKE